MLKPYFDKTLIEAGCDEAGRGCLAGPVFAAAVILPKKSFSKVPNFGKVNDSKKLTHEVRMELRPIIEKIALAFAIGIVNVEEIDEINILNASFLAMHRAIAKLTIEPELLLIDGNRFKKYYVGKTATSPATRDALTSYAPNLRLPSKGESTARFIPHKCIIEGDGKYLSIACASILAKTYRDDHMNELHEQFPHYKWNQNKAYATRAHRSAIEKHGITEHHRKSFTLLSSRVEMDL